MDPDFVFIMNYACPRCQAGLEARVTGAPRWLRCPACGRAGLPPEHDRRQASPTILDDRMFIGDLATGAAKEPLPVRPRGMAPRPAPEAAKTPTARLLLGTGFFLTTILFVFSLLDFNGMRAGIFGLIAVACLVLLTRRTGRPRED